MYESKLVFFFKLLHGREKCFAVEEVRFSLNIQAKMWQETTERQTV